MPKYIVKLPYGKGRFNGVNRRDAIDQAIKIWRLKFDEMIENGSIYAIPEIAKVWKPRDAVEALGIDEPFRRIKKNKRRK